MQNFHFLINPTTETPSASFLPKNKSLRKLTIGVLFFYLTNQQISIYSQATSSGSHSLKNPIFILLSRNPSLYILCSQNPSHNSFQKSHFPCKDPIFFPKAMFPWLNDELSKRTVIFGLHLWVVVGISVGAAFVLLLFLISLWIASRRPKSSHHSNTSNPIIPTYSKEIQEIPLNPKPIPVTNHSSNSTERKSLVVPQEEENTIGLNRIHIEIGKDHRITYPERASGGAAGSSGECRSAERVEPAVPEVSHLGWGHWYTLRELEDATNMFADENVIGEGGYGIVYHGLLRDNMQIAVKNLLNNRGQAEREFKVEVEAIGRVRHKNLVKLLGYCAEGAHRMLVYEYVDNGNLEQWIHGDAELCNPLAWEIRMNIILGTAKGLMYLHEGLEPKVVHRDVKSSNILIDKQWNPKVSDFGLAKLLGSERSYVTTRVMGTFGYVAPEYASTGMLNERSDVYSFGILIMEIISGRNPVDYSRPAGEVILVEWLKSMVSNRDSEGVLDPKLPEKPTSRALKRALLVALRCVDPDSHKRPKMGHVIHMLEVDDFPYRDERRGTKYPSRAYRESPVDRVRLSENPEAEPSDSSANESTDPIKRPSTRWIKQVE